MAFAMKVTVNAVTDTPHHTNPVTDIDLSFKTVIFYVAALQTAVVVVAIDFFFFPHFLFLISFLFAFSQIFMRLDLVRSIKLRCPFVYCYHGCVHSEIAHKHITNVIHRCVCTLRFFLVSKNSSREWIENGKFNDDKVIAMQFVVVSVWTMNIVRDAR